MSQDLNFGTDELGRTFVDVGGRRLFNTGRKPYYSRGRIPFVRTGADGAWVYTAAAGTELNLFSYVKGQSGSPQGVSGTATFADTNLINDGHQTNSGELVLVRALGLEFMPGCDPEAVKVACAEMSVSIDRASTRKDYLGGLLDWPAGRGLNGLAPSSVTIQPQLGGKPLVGALSNGAAVLQNLRDLPDPFIWAPQGKGDSTFAIVLRAERALVINSQAVERTDGAALHGYDMPADGAYLLDVKCHIIGETFAEAAAA